MKNQRLISLLLPALMVSLAVKAATQEAPEPAGPTDLPRVLSAKDVLSINQVSSPQISPDGHWVLYAQAVRDFDDKEMKSRTHLWRARTDAMGRRQVTFGDDDTIAPAWSPDGEKIAFLSKRGGDKNQIFMMYADGGEAWKVTDHEESISGFEISPAGDRILFLAQDKLSDEEKEKQENKDDTIVVDEKFRFTHLWVFDIQSKQSTRQTEGTEWTVSDAHWSPNGVAISFVTRPNTKVDEGWNSDVWIVDVDSKEKTKVRENPGSDSSPRWSPDGRYLAYSFNDYVGTNTLFSTLVVDDLKTGAERQYLQDYDGNFGTPIWAADGQSIYWVAGNKTSFDMFRVNLASGQVEPMPVAKGANFQFDRSEVGSQWVWVHSNSDWPSEIYTAAAGDMAAATRLSDANEWMRKEGVKIAQAEVISWKNTDGQEIEGVLTFPVDFQAGQRYPLLLNPHGGPSGAVTTSFNTSAQYFAGNGFMVLQPNFRGSSNYGQEFVNANRGYWGIRDYDDCMTGVDDVIERGWADADRMIAYGWSYGGYMTFWMSTQTDRFKLISPGAGLSNLYSMYSTTDIPAYLAWFFGQPWDDEEIYRRLSPIRHAKNVKSDLLIMTGAEDKRVPPEQSIEFYQAMNDLGKPVTLVMFPREGHGIREPRHAMDRLRRYLYAFSEKLGIEPISERAWEEEQRQAKDEREADTKEEQKEEATVSVTAADDLGIFEVVGDSIGGGK